MGLESPYTLAWLGHTRRLSRGAALALSVAKLGHLAFCLEGVIRAVAGFAGDEGVVVAPAAGAATVNSVVNLTEAVVKIA